MVVSSEPEKTRLEDAARARTAPLCPVSVARHFSVFTSQTRTCHTNDFYQGFSLEFQGGRILSCDPGAL